MSLTGEHVDVLTFAEKAEVQLNMSVKADEECQQNNFDSTFVHHARLSRLR